MLDVREVPNTPETKGIDTMAQKRETATLAEFVKFSEIGGAIMGQVARIGKNDNGRFVVFSPAMYRPSKRAEMVRLEEAAAGLATDLDGKVRDTDTNKILLIVFVAEKPTSRLPMRLFSVFELTQAEALEIAKTGTVGEGYLVAPTLPESGGNGRVAAPIF